MVSVYHVIRLRMWPYIMAVSVILGFVRLFLLMKVKVNFFLFLVSLVIFSWFKDVSRERDYYREHRFLNNDFFKVGMILFIRSEVMFFFSFFWCYFDFVLVVDVELGRVWPPKGISRINPFRVPLLNTLILLSSGVIITWSHFSILENNWLWAIFSMMVTLVLGVYFLLIQWKEYYDTSYSFIRRGYGGIFFLATGFHGFHVFLGCSLIIGNLNRIWKVVFDRLSHWNFEFVAWYWHFVDVVWLFLYLFVYWWGN